MMFLLGQLEAIRFPLVWESETRSQAYYDLLDSITNQYRGFIKQLYPDWTD